MPTFLFTGGMQSEHPDAPCIPNPTAPEHKMHLSPAVPSGLVDHTFQAQLCCILYPSRLMLESRCSCLRFLLAMQQLYSNHHRVERCAPRTCTPCSGSETRRYRECRWKRHRGMCRRLRLQDQGRAAPSARACCPTRARLPRAHCHYPFRMLHRSGRSAHLQQIHKKVRQEPGTEDTHK